MGDSIDTAALKLERPIAEVVGRYGIALRPSGRALVGRCPFHVDRGRPNLHVYPANDSWYCYRCAAGGDVIRFVERIEGVGFREAVARLRGEARPTRRRPVRFAPKRSHRRERPTMPDPDERACLAAAVELYHNRLLGDPTALAYVEGRGIDRATIDRYRLGYASGEELAAYLRWQRLPLGAALRARLLGHDGREWLAGRVIVPEIRGGQPDRLAGRWIGAGTSEARYLGLPGCKPLLGWDAACSARAVFLTEGPFDWLTLRRWGYPALALVGTHAAPAELRTLGRFGRIYLVLDGDEAGRVATEHLLHTLPTRVTPLSLPGVKDVAELGLRSDGPSVFAEAIRLAEGRDTPMALPEAA